MITLEDIKKECVGIMEKHYPASTYRYYSNAVVEHFIRPCFFTEISIEQSEAVSSATERFRGQFSIEILQDTVDESEALGMATTLKKAFGRYFMATLGETSKKRCIYVTGYDFDFVGTDGNVPVITIDLEWSDCLIDSVDTDVMESIDVSIKIEAED